MVVLITQRLLGQDPSIPICSDGKIASSLWCFARVFFSTLDEPLVWLPFKGLQTFQIGVIEQK
jgi:hypothetical protein